MEVGLTLAGSALSSFLQVLFDRMATPEFLNLFRGRKHDDRLLKKLKRKLLFIQAVLDDAENKQIRNQAVKEWLDDLQDVVYQADDLLDEINTEALRVKVEAEFENATDQVSSSEPSSNFSDEFLDEKMPKVEEILETLEDFELQIEPLGLKAGGLKKQPWRTPSTSLVDETRVCGRAVDRKKIIEMVLSDAGNGDNFTVIPIVGLGGIGKTTLAQLVYNDHRVKSHFDKKAWVCISEDYDAISITKTLLGELGISHPDVSNNFNDVQLKLQQGLTDHKFLLVLDDIWNSNFNDWDTLRRPFLGGAKGSKIIMTTRHENIALMMGNEFIHRLGCLSRKDSWSLFEKHAFGNKDQTMNSELEMVGKAIVAKCRGLPLAVKTLGGLLRSKSTVKEWDDILRSDIWDLPENQNDIIPALRLSYNHLPSSLKRCFAYCAVFHKDYEFKKDEAIYLWIANDLLECPKNNKRIEDVGDGFFHELRLRSLIQMSRRGNFFMHDLVNDLAKFAFGKYCFRVEDGLQQHERFDRVRHFSFLSNSHNEFLKFKPLKKAKFLRTFLPITKTQGAKWCPVSHRFLYHILPTLSSLRVLSLFAYKISKLPDSLGNLKQLRLLNLSFTAIQKLPDWICTLYNLQTLLLIGCSDLKELPRDMWKLINLRHLDVGGTSLKKMPLGITKLKNLQFLSTFIASKDDGGPRIYELQELNSLYGKLAISGLENVLNGRDALMANIKSKKGIKELALDWSAEGDDSQVARDVLDNLQPHASIEQLKIDGYYGTSFPDWLQDRSFRQITSMRLSRCKHCFCLPSLGRLPSLRSLTIKGFCNISVMGNEIYGNDSSTKPFSSLKQLRIDNMPEWKEWFIPQDGVFSSLEELYIIDCPNLIGEIPSQAPLLRRFKISGCSKLVSSSGRMTIFDNQVNLSPWFISLREWDISNMPNLKELPDLDKFTSLWRLSVVDCPGISSFPFDGLPPALEELKVQNLGDLKFKTTEIGGTPYVSNGSSHKLESPGFNHDKNVEVLKTPLGNQSFTLLRELHVWSCENLVSFPVGGFSAPNLKMLCLRSCNNLKSLPESMHGLLPSLKQLYLFYCPKIECFPQGGVPDSLEHLDVVRCKKLIRRRSQWGLQRHPSLVNLGIYGTRKEPISLPDNALLPCTLKVLRLVEHENMTKLNYRGLQHLTGLTELSLIDCPKLQTLPEEGLPHSLTLSIIECPLLKPRLEWEKGEDWQKVAHIRSIKIDGELIP